MNGMVSCRNCTALNSLDSAFCKKCGVTLPDDEVQRAKEKLEAAVADGFKVFNAGRTDDAMLVAEAAVAANPLSTAALSLKAMCHERMGQISEALECHERVLEIDPDSMIDKIKVNDLRNLLVARSSVAAVPDRKMAIGSAVAAFVLVASIGIVIARTTAQKAEPRVAMRTGSETGAKGAELQTQASSKPIQPPGMAQQGGSQPPAPSGQAGAGTAGPSANAATQTSQPNPQQGAGEPVRLPQYSHPDGTGKLPNPLAGGIAPFRIDPDKVPHQDSQAATTTDPHLAAATGDPDPGVLDLRTNKTDPPQNQEAPGIMDIKIVSRSGQTTAGGSDGGSHNGAEALIRTARNQYQIGNYSAAATSYERALRAGADPASSNQRLAQCYEKLGRNSDAVAAYNRAISAMQADIDAGRGDAGRLNSALEVCRQAVKVLGG